MNSHSHSLCLQLEGDNITLKPRPSADLTNSSAPSPSHKVQRSVSANPKQRRFSDQGKSPGGLADVLTFPARAMRVTAELQGCGRTLCGALAPVTPASPVPLALQLVLPFPPQIPTPRRHRATMQRINGLKRSGMWGARPAAQPRCLPAPCPAWRGRRPPQPPPR